MPEQPKARYTTRERTARRIARRAAAPLRPAAPEPQAAPEARQAGANQDTLRALGIQARLTVSQPGDPDEQEADRAADAFVSGQAAPSLGARGGATIQRQCAGCADEAPIARKAGAAAPRLGGERAAIGAGHGQALSPHLQRDFGRFFNRDLSDVRVHTGAAAHTAADALAAQAFTRGGDIYFGRGRFDPQTGGGQHLLAHELAHTVQQSGRPDAGQRLQRAATCTVSGPPRANPDTDTVTKAVRDGDVDIVVTSMRGKGVPELCALRSAVEGAAGQKLERWLMSHRSLADALGTAARVLPFAAALAPPAIGPALATLSTLLPGGTAAKKTGATAEEGLRLILPVLPLIDKLELYDEGYREIEQAQLDIIRNASADERSAASAESARLEAIYAKMGVKEEYDARLLIDPEKKYAAAEHLLTRAPGVVSDDEDLVFDAIWALTPSERKDFYNKRNMDLHHLLSADRFKLLGTLSTGTEAEALIARLRLATESRIDDKEAIQAVVDRAIALLAEQKGLRATLAVTTLPPEELDKARARLAELGELEALVKFGKGKLDPTSFLGRLADAADSPDAFGAMAHKLGSAIADPGERTEFAFAAAKQRIMMAASIGGADEDAVRNAILELRAPPIADAVKLTPPERDQKQAEANASLRQRLVDDEDVKRVINGMVGSQRRRVLSFISADPFVEKLTELTLALNNARCGEFFQLVLQIALREDWKKRFEDTASSPFDTFARVHGQQRDIMLEILKSKRIPTEQILGFSGDVETLRAALSSMDEAERTQLRLGYVLSRSGRQPADDKAKDALSAYRKFDANLRKSQTTLGAVDSAGIEAVLDAALGTEPTAQEMATDEGKYDAAALMYERIGARLALGRGASALFTETDETMLAAGREFGARWLQLRERKPPKLTTIELGTLAAFYDQFNHRTEEFTEASNTAGEVAGMVAATIAGTLIVIGTGGVTAPAVIAAAAAGGGARVVTREMFGADYYNPVGGEGARDALLGGIDAALAVVGAALGAKGAELVGLGGKAFLTNAAKVGGQVAEQASGKLLHRVAAGSVEAAIDGAFSGFVSEAANAMTDSRTWRAGVWRGLVAVGRAALIGGMLGLAAGGVLGAALPVVGAGLRSAADKLLGASVERTLAKAGATETLEAARSAMRAGNTGEAERLFAQLEKHLSAEQANVLWRDMARLAEAASILEEPLTLLGERHTLKLVEGEHGAFFVLCSWCTRVRDVLKAALDKAADPAQISRLKDLITQVETMEANLAGGAVSKSEATSRNTLKSLLGKLTESEHLVGKGLAFQPRLSTPNFAKLANDPAVARRAEELYQGYLDQLLASRKEIFGKEGKEQLGKFLVPELEAEAQARALSQAQKELGRPPLELKPGEPARTVVDPQVDYPFGFFDRAAFQQFSTRVGAAVEARSPGAQLAIEGSGVTGRRFERIAAPHGPSGAPFGLGRLSDYDIAIISDALFAEAQRLHVPMSGGKVASTNPISPTDLARLKLTGVDSAARQGVLDATGIAFPVNFKIRPSSAAEAGPRLPLPQGAP
ncbi:DUF4157 domain-containing protein [Massilia antarctica]|uniref:DUF4157 domain-containing protein n=1 Tax=Massilia antarctica TaxID=2765360 RepID=A0AA48WA08_9BURK|nr:DUF4157 domain-containing protein [Massilia antarctica]QPI48567.1 DUF4157 domain-containing protein [Massilia antarctica]